MASSSTKHENKQENVYLASISSLGLDRLNQEPTRLRTEAKDIENSVARLALQNYRVFIANHDCVRTLRSQSKTVNESTTSLRTQLSTFILKAQEFRKNADEIMTAHHQNKHTLQQHMQILDVLELPQLMDACLRNLLFDGAIEIAAFANVLERRHSARAASSVIMGVVSEIRTSMISLRHILLKQLQCPIQLPACLNVISWLRRMDTLVLEKEANEKISSEKTNHLALSLELKLQVDFLEARTVWLESELDGAQDRMGFAGESTGETSRVDASRWTLDLIEKNRTLWFDIATQFLAIFNEDSKVCTSFILSSWLLLRVQEFTTVLRRCVPLIQTGAALYEVLDQTMFFGSSLGRLGVDFRPMVVPIFEDGVLNLVLTRWDFAVSDFAQSLKLNGVYPLHIVDIGSSDSTKDAVNPSGPICETLEHPEPPHSTLLFPALAHCMNMFLESFNELRQCAPFSLRTKFQVAFTQCMLRMALALSCYSKETSGEAAEVAQLLLKEAGEVAFPYLCTSLGYVFFGHNSNDMADQLQQSLYDSFLSQGLQLARKVPELDRTEPTEVPSDNIEEEAPVNEVNEGDEGDVVDPEVENPAPQQEVLVDDDDDDDLSDL